MVDIRPNQLPDAILPLRETDELVVDQGADGVRKAPPIEAVNSVAPVATQAEAVAGSNNIKRMTPLRTKQSIASEVGVTLASNSQGEKADSAVQSVNGKTGNSVTLVKGDVGLGNVDNTSDANKPISTATQTALNAKANSSVTISVGAGLTGGGNLTDNRTVSLNAASIASLAKADSSVQTVNGVAPTGGNVTVAAEEKRLQDTRTTAIAESFPSNVLFVETAGYSSVGDGGGALYKRVSSEPTHAGKFQSADGAWWELAETKPNLKMFGVAMDGSTATNEVQSAIDYSSITTGVLEVPKGVVASGRLNISRSIRISGEGTLKLASGVNDNFLLVTGTATKVDIANITIDGDHVSGRDLAVKYSSLRFSATGSASDHASLHLNNVTFLNGNWADIQVRTNNAFRDSLEEVTITNCKFLNGREGTTVNDDARCVSVESPCLFSFTNNLLDIITPPTQLGRSGLAVFDGHATGGSDVDGARSVIIGNILYGMGRSHATSTLAAIEVYNTARSIAINSNVLINSYGRGIQTKADALNVVISGNVVDTLSALPGQIVDSCIVINRATKPRARGNLTVTGNACTNSAGAGISISGQDLSGSFTTKGIVVCANVINNVATRGIAAFYTDSVVIDGNSVNSASEIGIYVDNINRRALISNNEVVSSGGAGVLIGASMVTAFVSVSGNIVDSAATIGIAVETGLNVSVIGNTTRNCTTQDLRIRNVTGHLVVDGNILTSDVSYNFTGLTGQVAFGQNTFANNVGTSVRVLSLSSSSARVVMDWHLMDTEGGASTGDLSTLLGGADGSMVTLRPNNLSRVVTVKSGDGNIYLNGNSDFALSTSRNSITLRKIGASWYEVGRVS